MITKRAEHKKNIISQKQVNYQVLENDLKGNIKFYYLKWILMMKWKSMANNRKVLELNKWFWKKKIVDKIIQLIYEWRKFIERWIWKKLFQKSLERWETKIKTKWKKLLSILKRK